MYEHVASHLCSEIIVLNQSKSLEMHPALTDFSHLHYSTGTSKMHLLPFFEFEIQCLENCLGSAALLVKPSPIVFAESLLTTEWSLELQQATEIQQAWFQDQLLQKPRYSKTITSLSVGNGIKISCLSFNLFIQTTLWRVAPWYFGPERGKTNRNRNGHQFEHVSFDQCFRKALSLRTTSASKDASASHLSHLGPKRSHKKSNKKPTLW